MLTIRVYRFKWRNSNTKVFHGSAVLKINLRLTRKHQDQFFGKVTGLDKFQLNYSFCIFLHKSYSSRAS